MPSKNAIKEYEAGAYYHIYNRGVEKRIIFQDDKDYKTFLSYLKFYLSPPTKHDLHSDLQGLSLEPIPPSRILKNYHTNIDLIAYCLMPNHFHFLIRQNDDFSMSNFMSSLITKYVRYFNTRYKRVGHLFQDRYKAVKIETEQQWIHLTKYIHLNPLDLKDFKAYKDCPRRLAEYKYSSYPNYLGRFKQPWIKPAEILANFSKVGKNSYQSFIEEQFDVTPIYFVALDYG